MSFLAMNVKVKVGPVVDPERMSTEEMIRLITAYKQFIRDMLIHELDTDRVIVEYDGSILKVRVPRQIPTEGVRTRCAELTKYWMATNLSNAYLAKDM